MTCIGLAGKLKINKSAQLATMMMDSRTLKRVDGIARAMSRSRVINQALEEYLDYEELPSNAGSRKPEATVLEVRGRGCSARALSTV